MGGRFVKGQSGNPGGRPRLTPEVSRALEMARENTAKAIQVFIDVIESDVHSVEERMKAAAALLDRGIGKPTQQTDVNLDANIDGRLTTTGKVDEAQLASLMARVSADLKQLAAENSPAEPGKK
jgi:hypothetical protein